MFPIDDKFFRQFATNPATFLTRMADFQRANFEAARRIAEINTRAFQEIAAITDPQAFVRLQPAIVRAAIEENVAALMEMWHALEPQDARKA